MANADAAVRQRQNEGLAMQTLGTNLNTIGAESYTKNFVDQLRAQTAGQQSPWVSLFSQYRREPRELRQQELGRRRLATHLHRPV